MKKELRGLIHVHSTYSFDGLISLPEIKELSKSRGIDFVLLSEHADNEQFTAEKMALMIEECIRLSDENFLVIPGLEFNCEGMHILALGLEEHIMGNNPEELVNEIHNKAGLAILAHVKYYDDIPYQKLTNLDGVEVWNSRYDGRFAPSNKSIKILSEFRKTNKSLPAYAGLDMHEKYSFGNIVTVIQSDGLDKQNILNSLKEGRFYSTNGLFRLYPKNDPSKPKNALFFIINVPIIILRKTRKAASKGISKAGIRMPKGISNLIKRFFS